MIDYNEHLINSTYNQLISNLVLWQYLKNRVKADREQGYKVVKNKEKLDKITSNILDTLPAFDDIDISNVKLYMPLEMMWSYWNSLRRWSYDTFIMLYSCSIYYLSASYNLGECPSLGISTFPSLSRVHVYMLTCEMRCAYALFCIFF